MLLTRKTFLQECARLAVVHFFQKKVSLVVGYVGQWGNLEEPELDSVAG